MNHHSHRGLDDVVRIEQDVEATNAAVKVRPAITVLRMICIA